MPKGSRTTIFFSSTCYDLAQVRTDLRAVAEEAGHDAIVSESSSFPIDPAHTVTENCLDAVRTKTDIFVLIVGGRYGSRDLSGKSITNLEYEEAVAKRLPIYVFVLRDILTMLRIWKDNPTGDFSSVVDTPDLFKFASDLQSRGDRWVFPFATAQDIAQTLRTQWSYLFADCLDLRAKLQPRDTAVLRLGPAALRIWIEKPRGWEYLLFARLLKDGVEVHRGRELDLELGVTFGRVTTFATRHEALSWVGEHFGRLSHVVDAVSRAINQGAEKAFGPLGQPGDLARIEHLAARVSDAYGELLAWTLEFLRVQVEPELQRLMELGAAASSTVRSDLKSWVSELYGKMEDALKAVAPGETVDFSLKLSPPKTEDFMRELERVNNLHLGTEL